MAVSAHLTGCPTGQRDTLCGCEASQDLTSTGGIRKASFQCLSEFARLIFQFFHLCLEAAQGTGARVLDHCILGGQRQVFEQAAQVTAATQDLIAFVLVLGLLAQCVYQLLPDCDDQLALRDEDLGGLAVAEAAGKDADGFEECSEIEPAVLGQVDLPVCILPTGRWRAERARTLEKRKKIAPSAGCIPCSICKNPSKKEQIC